MWATIGAMEALRDDAVERSPLVQTTAAQLAASAPQFDREGQLEALYRWAQRAIRFRADTFDLEHLRHPDMLLAEIDAHGQTSADCDDSATLLAALLRAMGHRSAFVVVGQTPTSLAHVFAAIVRRSGRIDPFDPQEGTPIGAWHPAIRRREIYL